MNFAVTLKTPRRGRPNGGAPPTDPAAARDAIVSGVLGGDLSASTTATIAKAQQAPQALALVLGSPEFQKR